MSAQTVVAIIPMLYIFTLPESPRFLLRAAIRATNIAQERKYVLAALDSLGRLNKTKLQAYRELFSIYYSLEEELDDPWYQTVKGLWTQRRTRNALIASLITFFLQQFCGVNVLAYYSTSALEPINKFKSQAYYVSIFLVLNLYNTLIAISYLWDLELSTSLSHFRHSS